jgi:GNAT superfamily N-acetyltransferase
VVERGPGERPPDHKRQSQVSCLTKLRIKATIGGSHEATHSLDQIPTSGRGVAVVRYVQIPGEPGAVELAATVADEWQGRGLGGALLARLIERAADEGHAVLRASVLAINGRSIAMLRRAGFRAAGGSGVLGEYERTLGW